MTARADAVVCVDFGSTFTKAVLVDLASGRLVASTSHPTTLPGADGTGDVLDGLDACLDTLSAADPRARHAEVLACSSAGGGLRIAVVGNEELVTAEAGRRVALSSGGVVVLVLSGGLTDAGHAELVAAAPDVVLLVGGTDGGNAEVLEADAAALAGRRWPGPVVVAGNVESQGRVAALFDESRTAYVLAPNVVPRIGVLAPDGARAAIREMFLTHVIGGKQLSRRPDPATGSGTAFTRLVRGATPDIVLTGVELLARGLGPARPGAGDVVVVDVGGATTDVHSVVEVDPEEGGLAREVVAVTPLTRTVEGDLGMRWSAVSTVEAAGLEQWYAEARRRREQPGLVATTAEERHVDEVIARAAVDLALKRHAGRSTVVVGPEGRVVERTGKDLREVDLLVGSGGVLRHGDPGVADRVVGPSTGDLPGGWQLPRRPRMVVDHDGVLAAAGLLAADHPDAAHAVLRTLAGGGD